MKSFLKKFFGVGDSILDYDTVETLRRRIDVVSRAIHGCRFDTILARS